MVRSLINAWGDKPRAFGTAEKAIANIPSELDQFYDSAMMRVSQPKVWGGSISQWALMWASLSRRPVTVREIEELCSPEVFLDSSEMTSNELLEPFTFGCAGLLTLDYKTGIVHLAHATLKDYFQRKKEMYFTRPEEEMTRFCVLYFLHGVFKKGPCK